MSSSVLLWRIVSGVVDGHVQTKQPLLRWGRCAGTWSEVGGPHVIFSKVMRRAVYTRIRNVEPRNSSMSLFFLSITWPASVRLSMALPFSNPRGTLEIVWDAASENCMIINVRTFKSPATGKHDRASGPEITRRRT